MTNALDQGRLEFLNIDDQERRSSPEACALSLAGEVLTAVKDLSERSEQLKSEIETLMTD